MCLSKNYFVYEGRLPSLNEYINACRANHQKGANFKRDSQIAVGWSIRSAWVKKTLYKANKAVVVHFTYYERSAKRDIDNVSGFAHKVILDALVQSGILPDDSQKWVVGLTDKFVSGSEQDKIVVEIEEVGE